MRRTPDARGARLGHGVGLAQLTSTANYGRASGALSYSVRQDWAEFDAQEQASVFSLTGLDGSIIYVTVEYAHSHPSVHPGRGAPGNGGRIWRRLYLHP